MKHKEEFRNNNQSKLTNNNNTFTGKFNEDPAALIADYENKATIEFQKTIELCPNDLESYKKLIDLLITDPRRDISFQLIDRAIEKFPNDLEFLRNRASSIYMFLGMNGTSETHKNFLKYACEDLKKYLLKFPNDYSPHIDLGMVYGKLGYKLEAVKEFELGSKLNPKKLDPTFYYLLGTWCVF